MTVGEIPAGPGFGTCVPVPVGAALAVPESFAWMQQAACRGVDAAEFFGTAMAKGRRRCRSCPVTEPCFWWAIVAESDLGYRFGLWGAATPGVRAQVAWVTGIDYARRRFAVAAAAWAPTKRAEAG